MRDIDEAMAALDVASVSNPRDLSMGQASLQADMQQAVKEWRAEIMGRLDAGV